MKMQHGKEFKLFTQTARQALFILGDPGAVGGAEDKVKTGGKKFDEQKVRKKNSRTFMYSVVLFIA